MESFRGARFILPNATIVFLLGSFPLLIGELRALLPFDLID
jgi:hypothetical protein